MFPATSSVKIQFNIFYMIVNCSKRNQINIATIDLMLHGIGEPIACMAFSDNICLHYSILSSLTELEQLKEGLTVQVRYTDDKVSS